MTADIAVEVFFDDEAICLDAMNQNDHENENLLGMKHQLPHGGRQTVLVKNQTRIMQPNSLLRGMMIELVNNNEDHSEMYCTSDTMIYTRKKPLINE